MVVCFKLCFVVILIIKLINVSEEFKNGAPNDIGDSMMPQHGVEPQPLPSPYKITSNIKNLKPLDMVSLFITPNDYWTPFKGFLIRGLDSNGTSVGFFRIDEGYKAVDSSTDRDTGATHTNNRDKIDMALYWEAPEILNGPIKFVATIVKDKKHFWVGVESEELIPDL